LSHLNIQVFINITITFYENKRQYVIITLDNLYMHILIYAYTCNKGVHRVSLSILDRCICGKLRRTTQAITQYYDRCLRQSSLSSSQFSLLLSISLNGNISISELGKKTGKDQTTITRNVEILRKHGYIQIMRKENDARKKALSITDAGKQKLAEVLPLWQKAQERIETQLGTGQLTDFFKTLQRLEQVVK